jgi:hypothetical protein
MTMSYKKIMIICIILASLILAGCLKAPDTDGDGRRDPIDVFPEDPYDWDDSDGDGIGDNAENDAGTNPRSPDTDGDGYLDDVDLDPLDASISIDSDGDSYHDGIDVFPDNASEWADTDKDGYGDNSDKFPEDAKYHTSIPKILSNYSFNLIQREIIYENEKQGVEYNIEVTNNETFGGNFTVTVETCNKVDRLTNECEINTQRSGSKEVYINPGETTSVKVKVFSEFMFLQLTFKELINVTAPEVNQPV